MLDKVIVFMQNMKYHFIHTLVDVSCGPYARHSFRALLLPNEDSELVKSQILVVGGWTRGECNGFRKDMVCKIILFVHYVLMRFFLESTFKISFLWS